MQSQTLDYAGVLSKIVGLLGRETDVGVRGLDGLPPLFIYSSGVLSASDVYGGEIVGYDRDALNLYLGRSRDVSVTLHPDQFVGAVWVADEAERAQTLRVVMGTVELEFRSGL